MQSLDLQKIIELSEVHPLKIRSIFVYGSQVYGYATDKSDYDIILVAGGLLPREIKDYKYNIHHIMPDTFANDLEDYKIKNLECYYAPDWAKLLIKKPYELIIDDEKFKHSILKQSHEMWRHAKFKFNEGDLARGNKSAFHALKILIFGEQIRRLNKIEFSSTNDLYKEMMNYYFYKWNDLKEKYLPLKNEFEENFKK